LIVLLGSNVTSAVMDSERFSNRDQMRDSKLTALIERTGLLHEAVYEHVSTLIPADGQRCLVAFQAGILSMEHATAALVLVSQGLVPSAFTLMRPQYESLVRGIWLLHAASDTWVQKLSEPLTVESARRANEGPMLAEMLKQLETSEDAPGHIVEQLKVCRDVTWKGMNSYAHGGLHPLSRVLTGYPAQLSFDMVRNSNAVVALATQLVSVLTGDPRDMGPVRQLHYDFSDCMLILS
jgi:hypothetical protein